jgi:hypothetical protein
MIYQIVHCYRENTLPAYHSPVAVELAMGMKEGQSRPDRTYIVELL